MADPNFRQRNTHLNSNLRSASTSSIPQPMGHNPPINGNTNGLPLSNNSTPNNRNYIGRRDMEKSASPEMHISQLRSVRVNILIWNQTLTDWNAFEIRCLRSIKMQIFRNSFSFSKENRYKNRLEFLILWIFGHFLYLLILLKLSLVLTQIWPIGRGMF